MYQNAIYICILWCSKIWWFLMKKFWCQHNSRGVTWLSIAFSNWFWIGKLILEIRICEMTYLTYLRACLPLYSRACVLTCLACFWAYMPTSSQDWCDCVLACSHSWVLGVLASLNACVFVQVLSMLACFMSLRAHK